MYIHRYMRTYVNVILCACMIERVWYVCVCVCVCVYVCTRVCLRLV